MAPSAQLVGRFYKAPASDGGLRFTRDLISGKASEASEAAAEVDDLHLDERAYFVIQFDDGAPGEVIETLDEAADVRTEDSCISLEACFEYLTETQQLSGHDSVYCSSCKEHREMFKRLDLWSLPPVLVLQLKRFEVNGYARRRLSTPVRFPLEGLDLQRFCQASESFPLGECLRADQLVQIHGLKSAAGQKMNGLEGRAMYLDAKTSRFCVRMQEGDPCEDWKKVQPSNLRPLPCREVVVPNPAIFDLIGMSKHMGVTSFGHYVSYARSSEDGRWRLFDDEDVAEVSAEKVASEHTGAYVLFYLRRDLRPASWGAPKQPEANSRKSSKSSSRC